MNSKSRRSSYILLIIVSISFLLRVYHLEDTPLEYDEAIWGNIARNVLEKGMYCRNIWQFPIFVDHPPVHLYHMVLSFMVGGVSTLSLRLPTIIISLFLIFLFYEIYRHLELTGAEEGSLLAALLVGTLPYGITMSRSSHVEISVLFYGTLALLLLLKYRHSAHLSLFFGSGVAFSLSMFCKFLGFLFILPLLLLIFNVCRISTAPGPARFRLLKQVTLFCSGVALGSIVVNLVLASQINFSLIDFYRGVLQKFLNIIIASEVSVSPWRTYELEKFINSLHRNYYPAFILGMIAGFISFFQLLGDVINRTDQPHRPRKVLLTELVLFLSSTSFICLLCFGSEATRNVNYAFIVLPFYCLLVISVFYRLILQLSGTRVGVKYPQLLRIIKVVIFLLFLGLIVQGFFLENSWEIQPEKEHFKEIARQIMVLTKQNQYVIINPYGPEISFLTNRPYNFLYTCQNLDEVKTRLKRAKAVVLKKETLPHFSDPDMQILMRLIKRRFKHITTVGDVDIYKRRGIRNK
ncbi:ArnT family glycosyltransferase [candidate division CSSED10-310 bacterium]|uniref:ArnT family glycosyltransferase n=1 Tax=candidate division CSSED10-310 bacterium TaxID=2855610 RepID=A0ABV6YTZ9_UNCC1